MILYKVLLYLKVIMEAFNVNQVVVPSNQEKDK